MESDLSSLFTKEVLPGEALDGWSWSRAMEGWGLPVTVGESHGQS